MLYHMLSVHCAAMFCLPDYTVNYKKRLLYGDTVNSRSNMPVTDKFIYVILLNYYYDFIRISLFYDLPRLL